jgi:molybdopterin converting factor small subunit
VSVKLYIHKTHRQHTDGHDVVDVNGQTIGECLDDLIVKYPGMRAALFQRKGNLLNYIEVYLNMESAYPDELKKPVADGDAIHITLLLAGG